VVVAVVDNRVNINMVIKEVIKDKGVVYS